MAIFYKKLPFAVVQMSRVIFLGLIDVLAQLVAARLGARNMDSAINLGGGMCTCSGHRNPHWQSRQKRKTKKEIGEKAICSNFLQMSPDKLVAITSPGTIVGGDVSRGRLNGDFKKVSKTHFSTVPTEHERTRHTCAAFLVSGGLLESERSTG